MTDFENVKVLIIDDEPNIRISLEAFLEDCGFEVDSRESAEEALDYLEHNQVQIAIVDLRLPEMNGDLFVQKAYAFTPDTKFIIHTGSVEYSISQELRDIGLNSENILLKPIPDLNELVTKIEKILNS